MRAGDIITGFSGAGYELHPELLALDISDGQDCGREDFTVIREGLISLKAELSPRTAVRHFISGDRTVVKSGRAEFTAEMLEHADGLMSFIAAAAADRRRVRYYYRDMLTGDEREGTAAVTEYCTAPSEIHGRIVRIRLSE